MVKEFHPVSRADKRPVFVDRFVEDIALNCDVVDVIEDRDCSICFGRHFRRSVEGDSHLEKRFVIDTSNVAVFSAERLGLTGAERKNNKLKKTLSNPQCQPHG